VFSKIKNIFYGWWIVFASFGLLVITGGTALYGFTAFFNPISTEMKWGSAAISFAFSLRSVEGGVLQPLIGFFVERIGIRKCILIGIVLMGISLIFLSQISTLWEFYVAFVVLSTGFTMAAGIPEYTAVANWFQKRRSLALGILTTGWGVSGTLTPIIVLLIGFFGWRHTLLILGPFVLIVGLMLGLIVKDRPESNALAADVVSESDNPSENGNTDYPNQGFTLSESLKTKTFWLILSYILFVQFAFSTIPVQEMPHLINAGIAKEMAALTMTGYALCSLFGRLGFSWLGDIWNKKYLLAIAAAMQSVGFFFYANIRSEWMIIPFIILYGVGFGATVPLITAIQADCFGVRSFATVRGVLSISFAIPGIFAPVFAGWIFDRYHTYTPAFTAYAGLTTLAIPIILMISNRNVHRFSGKRKST